MCRVPSPAPIRNDLDVPVMVVQAEGDVIGSNLGARQPDTPMFREWEIAGTSHADAYTTSVGFGDIGDGRGATQMLALMRTRRTRLRSSDQRRAAPLAPASGVPPPRDVGAHRCRAADRAATRGDLYVSRGPRARRAGQCPRRGSLAPGRCTHRDNRRDQSGAGFCRLFGSTTPFTPAQLATLYPTHQDFVTKWAASLFVNTLNGFLLPEDVGELYSAAAAAPIPS